MDQAANDRLMMDARTAAMATRDGDTKLQDLESTLRQSGLPRERRQRLLVQAWESAVEGAVEGAVEDGIITLDEESALVRYLDHFGISTHEVNVNGAHTSLIQAAVIRDVTQGIISQRQNIQGQVPFNLMKSETLVWVIQGVNYLETVTRRERRGTSHGVSIRVARGLYYRPTTFRSRPVEWEETIHADTGLLGLTTKHIYFAGPRK